MSSDHCNRDREEVKRYGRKDKDKNKMRYFRREAQLDIAETKEKLCLQDYSNFCCAIYHRGTKGEEVLKAYSFIVVINQY